MHHDGLVPIGDLGLLELGVREDDDQVTRVRQAGGRAVGLTGQDGAFIRARKLMMSSSSKR
mgnify:CR=1 FL=1